MEPFITLNEIDAAADYIRDRITIKPRIGLVLGSGLGKLADAVSDPTILPFNEIPSWPVSTIHGHAGRLVIGDLFGVPSLVMQGRVHYYEGYAIDRVTLPIRVMQRLGIEILIVTNAAGAINPDYVPGDVMLLVDHINMIRMGGLNPLRGPNMAEFGERFPDMSRPYDYELIEKAKVAAEANQINLHEGVYVCLAGPSFESPADLRFLRKIGADAVGMSTVPEVIAANHIGLPCAAISVLTDECDPDNLQPADIGDILKTAGLAEEKEVP